MSVETGILDTLTAKPTSYLFNTQPPACRSEAARKMAAGFSYKSHLSPMVYSSEAGLGEYPAKTAAGRCCHVPCTTEYMAQPSSMEQPRC
jgi:hypothetical protein